MQEDTPPWVARVTAHLIEAEELQELESYEKSLRPVNEVLSLLDEFDGVGEHFSSRINALLLRVNAVCRRETKKDLADSEIWMAGRS